jgi:hypothetical protein
MTKPNDTDNDIAVTSRWRFLRNGSSLGGAAIAEGPFGHADALHSRCQELIAREIIAFSVP